MSGGWRKSSVFWPSNQIPFTVLCRLPVKLRWTQPTREIVGHSIRGIEFPSIRRADQAGNLVSPLTALASSNVNYPHDRPTRRIHVSRPRSIRRSRRRPATVVTGSADTPEAPAPDAAGVSRFDFRPVRRAVDVQGGPGPLVDRRGRRAHRGQRDDHPWARHRQDLEGTTGPTGSERDIRRKAARRVDGSHQHVPGSRNAEADEPLGDA